MPRRRVIPILFFAWLGNAFALEPFDERVQLAKAAESDEQLKAYLPAMYGSVGPQLASMLRNCIDRTDGADKSPFVMIADISSTGAAQGVETQPITNVGQCFARGFATISFPAPPASPKRAAYPLVIEMRIPK